MFCNLPQDNPQGAFADLNVYCTSTVYTCGPSLIKVGPPHFIVCHCKGSPHHTALTSPLAHATFEHCDAATPTTEGGEEEANLRPRCFHLSLPITYILHTRPRPESHVDINKGVQWRLCFITANLQCKPFLYIYCFLSSRFEKPIKL